MALDFPNTPAVGAVYSSGSAVWTWDGAKWVNAGGIVGPTGPMGPPAGRNFLHNALFQVQQRGAGPWTATSYTVDRWLMSAAGDTVSCAPVAVTDAIRSAAGDEAFTYFLSNTITGSSAATAYSEFVYRSESVRRLSGKTVTLSFWAWSAGSLQLGLSAANVYGTTGSPSPADVVTLPFVQLTPSVTRYSRTFTVPSAVGKTFGGAGTDFFQLQFWSSSGANNAPTAGIGVQSGTVNIMGPQLEIGLAATPLEKVEPRYDLANCQRFYVVQAGYLYGLALSATDISVLWTFPVPMRAGPNVTLLTTTPYCEQPPYSGAHTGSGSTQPNNHAGSNTGFDIHINGFTGLTAATVASLGPGCLAASADL